ncbi:hypothetical protein [Streptomyces xanthophaeus]|uniref:hypothetical protein n=1 Tax=Streptomyces xanthophaeus TaxID=67385 RepID=UPI00345FAB82|nr:hypothetical protein KO717_36205 [Streptomyces xanthophaeus]
MWGMAAWAAGILALLVVLPLAARKGRDDLTASHRNALGEPDGSDPVWPVVLVPVVIRVVLVTSAVCWRAARRWRRGSAGEPSARVCRLARAGSPDGHSRR